MQVPLAPGFVPRLSAPEFTAALCLRGGGDEVIRIAHDGRLFWRGREVESDEALREALLDLRDALMRPGVARCV